MKTLVRWMRFKSEYPKKCFYDFWSVGGPHGEHFAGVSVLLTKTGLLHIFHRANSQQPAASSQPAASQQPTGQPGSQEVVVSCTCTLLFGPLLGSCFCLLCPFCFRLPKLFLNRFEIRKCSWKSPQSSMGRLWCPKWIQVENIWILDYLALPVGTLFETLSVGNMEKMASHLFVVLRPSPKLYFIDVCSILGEFFRHV